MAKKSKEHREAVTIRVLLETKEKLPFLAAANDESQMDMIKRLVDAEKVRVDRKLAKKYSPQQQ